MPIKESEDPTMHRTAFPLLRTIFTASLLFPLAMPGLRAQTVSLDPPVIEALGAEPEVVATGDLNRDGALDLAIANTGAGGSGGDTIDVLLGNGGGGFRKVGPFATGARPEGLVLALANDDQVLDAVTADHDGDSISILLGNGQGGFRPRARIAVAGGPRFVAAEDLDGDRRTDFVTSNYRSNEVSVIRGLGRGRFTLQATIPVDRGPEVVAIGDLNGDEFPDLVTANALGHTVTPIAGGPGGFAAGPHHPAGRTPRFVVARDLNGDGLDDLLVARYGDDAVSIEINTGGLSFRTAEIITASIDSVPLEEPVYLAFADVTGDGIEDLLVTWADTKTFTVHPGTAQGAGFGDFWPVRTGDTPVGIAAADLNEDGALDIVVANALDDNASIYLTYAAHPGVILDNDSPGTTRIGPWVDSTSPYAFGRDSLFSKDGTRFLWEADLPAPGLHEVLLWWAAGSSRSPGVIVEVSHRDGKSGLIVDQRQGMGTWSSLGTYAFQKTAMVTLTSPQDGESVSADAVRFRPVPGSPARPPVTVSVAVEGEPDGTTTLADGRTLALHGRFSLAGAARAQEWLAAVVTPAGEGEESASIRECRLYADSNRNRVHDEGDRQLGPPRSFGSDIRAAVFDGFAVSLPPRESTDFFIVCQIGRRVASRSGTGAGRDAAAVAIGALFIALAARGRRGRRLGPALALVLLVASGLLLSSSGCGGGSGGGGGGGGGPEPVEVELRLELTSIVVADSGSGAPTPFLGLPAKAWKF
jgi:hypothetical protein